jgi:hypothetical protein
MVLRPQNSVLLIKTQTAEGTPATPSAAVDAIPFESDSIGFSNPYSSESSNEVTGSLVSGSPLVVGQPATIRFRSRVKGANATYTASVKPPLHQALAICGVQGFFQAAITAALLTAGTATTGTLGTGFSASAQAYLGMPLIIGAGVGNGHTPLVTDYTAGKVATLSDSFSPALDTTTSVSIPANWTYAGTSPRDATDAASDHPAGTIYWYEDGVLHQFVDCRGKVDFSGDTAKPGFAEFEINGIYVSSTDVSVPTGAVIANWSAPLLVKGSGTPPAALVNRKQLPISKWSSMTGGSVESPADPNTTLGFGAGQIGPREPTFGCDPLAALMATRNTLAEIAAFTQYPIALRFGSAAGNRWSLLHPLAQPVSQDLGTRGAFRSHDQQYRVLTSGRDAQDRDADRILCFY